MGWPQTDDAQGAQLGWLDWSALPMGRIWPWLAVTFGVMAVVVGAVLFSPDVVFATSLN